MIISSARVLVLKRERLLTHWGLTTAQFESRVQVHSRALAWAQAKTTKSMEMGPLSQHKGQQAHHGKSANETTKREQGSPSCSQNGLADARLVHGWAGADLQDGTPARQSAVTVFRI